MTSRQWLNIVIMVFAVALLFLGAATSDWWLMTAGLVFLVSRVITLRKQRGSSTRPL